MVTKMLTTMKKFLNAIGRCFVQFGEWLMDGKAQVTAQSEPKAAQAKSVAEPIVAAKVPQPVQSFDVQPVSSDPKTDIPADPFTVNIPDEIGRQPVAWSANGNAGDQAAQQPEGSPQGLGGQGTLPASAELPKFNIPAPQAKPIPPALRSIISGGGSANGNTRGGSGTLPPPPPPASPPQGLRPTAPSGHGDGSSSSGSSSGGNWPAAFGPRPK